jgi:predicted CoA-binding protein
LQQLVQFRSEPSVAEQSFCPQKSLLPKLVLEVERVMRVLHEIGHEMIPVDPMEAGHEIRGLKVYESLSAIGKPVDMVQVFRTSDAALEVAKEAIKIGAKVLWMQIGVHNDEAARLAEEAGLKVVMNRYPKIELFRPFWKPRLNQAI